MAWKDHVDKIGVVGSFVAAACCLGLPAVISLIAAMGLGFIVNDATLLPLMALFLSVTLIGLYFGYRVHRRPWAVATGVISSVAVLFFIFVHTVSFAAYLAVAGLVFSSLLNILLRQKSAQTA